MEAITTRPLWQGLYSFTEIFFLLTYQRPCSLLFPKLLGPTERDISKWKQSALDATGEVNATYFRAESLLRDEVAFTEEAMFGQVYEHL